MSSQVKVKLISRKHVKLFALSVAGKRAHRFTRVGGEFYIKCEANLKQYIRDYVHRLPSVGKTIN
jgi:predicted SpoU family rRNA methylase